MIKIDITRDAANQIQAFEVSGHADFAGYGSDIVCAGVSAVTIGAVNSIIALCDVTPLIEQGGEGGYLYCEIPADVEPSTFERIQLLLEGMIVSLESIERDYQSYIKIN
ncbi:ribosomal-processing cysteine protease Prp [Priestia koreensis]|uniref:ribosomal-processing cysteine protease Prp n=1 Tax=Priestia koreensis TaxID=284581 RepID=UPI00203C2ED6|nr:ribosomal-processing cysteine protease Prp [Priestia koreensis]MCM3002637.1 ribosomal-processing cysteine protease Prp [Priestia koreensis]